MSTRLKKVTLKIEGVQESEISAFHKSMLPVPGVTVTQGNVTRELAARSTGQHPYMKVLSSVLDPDNRTYTVKVELIAEMDCVDPRADRDDLNRDRLLRVPQAALLQVFSSFEGLFPEKETMVPVQRAKP